MSGKGSNGRNRLEKDGEKKFLSLLIPMDSSWNWLPASGIGSRMHGTEQN